jgi:hypothetical protein
VGDRERFETKVDRSGGPDACHIWTGTVNDAGYGYFWFEGKNRKAHRVAYFFMHGRWPEPCCCHQCDTPGCVNGAHLFEGTDADNHADRDAKGRQRTPRGEGHGSAKLTTEDVLYVREQHSAGVSARELARRLGVASRTVDKIVNGERWNHV